MIEPLLSEDAFLADVVASRDDRSDTFRLWWLGQSGYLLQYKGAHLLIDPYLSDSLTEKYANTDKPHIRMTRRVIDPACLDFIDLVTSSHAHTDHLDPPTLRALVAANPDLSIVVPAAHEKLAAERAGVNHSDVLPINYPNMSVSLNIRDAPLGIVAVPAAHPQIEADAAGLQKHLGYVIRVGKCRIYHSGDTLVFPGMAKLPALQDVDLAILPINGKVDNMGGADAARLAKAINAKVVIPCHYEMFEFNTADPAAEFIPECKKLGQRYRILRAGERFDSIELSANALD